MERSWNYFGKDLTDEHHRMMITYFSHLTENGLARQEGEFSQTLVERNVLKAVKSYLREEFNILNVAYTPFRLGQFHFVDYAKPNAYRQKGADFAVINRNGWNEYELPLALIHESLHLLSFRTYHANTELIEVAEYRSGYAIQSPRELDHEHFYGFDDAIVEKFSREILTKHKDELSSLTQSDLNKNVRRAFSPNYRLDLQVVNNIIKGVAKHTRTSQNRVWYNLKRGLFTGNLTYLKAIDHTFGPGSLRVLGAWESANVKMDDHRLDEIMLRFFQTEDLSDRRKLAKEVLNERERFRYNQYIK
jgi:hypothetical protein